MRHDIKFILNPIDCGNDLDEDEAKILEEAVRKIRKKRDDHFSQSLNEASKIVASWPKWKRELAQRCLRPG